MSPTSDLRGYFLRLFAGSPATNNPFSAPAANADEPPKQLFRTDNDSSDTITLPDGRKLGYAQYGSLTGQPIFYMHGLPGSRLQAAGFDALGLEVGARIIAVDRPGIGWSSPHPSRTLLDHPKDVEQLANHLGLSHYGVLVRNTSPPEHNVFETCLLNSCSGNFRRWTFRACVCGSFASREAQGCFDSLRHGPARHRYEWSGFAS
jgi:hypothetical protein